MDFEYQAKLEMTFADVCVFFWVECSMKTERGITHSSMTSSQTTATARYALKSVAPKMGGRCG